MTEKNHPSVIKDLERDDDDDDDDDDGGSLALTLSMIDGVAFEFDELCTIVALLLLLNQCTKLSECSAQANKTDWMKASN